MRKILLALTVLYLLALGQFIFSNFAHTLGPSYTIRSSGYTRDYNAYCSPQLRKLNFGSCPGECPNITQDTPYVTPVVKGFPFVVYQDFNMCGARRTTVFRPSDFTAAITLNALYIVSLTVAYFLASRRVARTAGDSLSKSSAKPTRRAH